MNQTPNAASAPETSRWLSAHLFFADDPPRARELGDRVLLDVVAPLVRQCLQQGSLDRYFFIRYSELGPHIRLRMQAGAEVLERVVRPALHAHAELAGEPRVDAVGPLFPSAHARLAHVRWIPYRPELPRYGGPAGMRAAEEFFFCSSEAGLALLQQGAAGDASIRSAKALLAMVVLLHAMAEDRAHAAALAHRYSDYMLDNVRKQAARGGFDKLAGGRWRETFEAGHARQAAALSGPVHGLWDALAAGDEVPAPFAAYHRALVPLRQRLAALQQAGALVVDGFWNGPGDTSGGSAGGDVRHGVRLADWPQATRALVPSYLHMMNNRLGILPMEEAYLGHLLGRLLLQ